MQVIFRADASLEIGTGHVIRCLTLARALKDCGAEVKFICRKQKGNLIRKIREDGFNVHELDWPSMVKVDVKLAHSHWLGVTQSQDACNCVEVLKSTGVDLLIVDHYALDEDWHRKLKPYCKKIMVIDDLADRSYACDILLDQTFGRKPIDYKSLVPKDCKLLLGSGYALLRPEFTKWRRHSLKRQRIHIKNLLVNMGGVDMSNVTEKVLNELKRCTLLKDAGVTVVMGEGSPNAKRIQSLAGLPYQLKIKVGADNMAELMANSDVAIGASGSTTWERCCLGLPSIQVTTANNQMSISKNLESIGAICLINDIGQLSLALGQVSKAAEKLSLRSASIVDGMGLKRVVNVIYHGNNAVRLFCIRPAKISDSDFVYSLQTPNIRKYFLNPDIPSMDRHNAWYQELLNSTIQQLFILMLDDHKVGVVRIDDITIDEKEVSIIVSPDFGRKGLAKKALEQIGVLVYGKKLRATVHNKNIASKSLFIRSGYVKISDNGIFSQYRKKNE